MRFLLNLLYETLTRERIVEELKDGFFYFCLFSGPEIRFRLIQTPLFGCKRAERTFRRGVQSAQHRLARCKKDSKVEKSIIILLFLDQEDLRLVHRSVRD